MHFKLVEVPRSVVVPTLEEVDSTSRDEVHDPVLLRESPGPNSRPQILQRLRLCAAPVRIAEHGFDEIQHAGRRFPICLDPEAEILPKLGVENRSRNLLKELLTAFCQDPSRA